MEKIVEQAEKAFVLPVVAGRMSVSHDDFERACLVHIERLQHGLGDYDSAMMNTFCEAVRLVREYNGAMAVRQNEIEDNAKLRHGGENQ